jgi:hypothetical protein
MIVPDLVTGKFRNVLDKLMLKVLRFFNAIQLLLSLRDWHVAEVLVVKFELIFVLANEWFGKGGIGTVEQRIGPSE